MGKTDVVRMSSSVDIPSAHTSSESLVDLPHTHSIWRAATAAACTCIGVSHWIHPVSKSTSWPYQPPCPPPGPDPRSCTPLHLHLDRCSGIALGWHFHVCIVWPCINSFVRLYALLVAVLAVVDVTPFTPTVVASPASTLTPKLAHPWRARCCRHSHTPSLPSILPCETLLSASQSFQHPPPSQSHSDADRHARSTQPSLASREEWRQFSQQHTQASRRVDPVPPRPEQHANAQREYISGTLRPSQGSSVAQNETSLFLLS